MYQLILVIHVLVAAVIIGLVLIQQGKGADVGASFGSGASGTVFGSQGVGTFLFKLTAGLAITFFVTSLLLSSIVASQYAKASQAALPQVPSQLESKTMDTSIPVPVDIDKK